MSRMYCTSPAQMNCGTKLLLNKTHGAISLTACRLRMWAALFDNYRGARYYQENAINHVMEAIAGGQQRILLTLATGTGKTFIAFQIAWKLFQSRWNLSREPTRRPRVLFLADRNILANQAYNAFSAFAEDALVRIKPDEISKKGRVPKNGSIFFTIFQTFMTLRPAKGERHELNSGRDASVRCETLSSSARGELVKHLQHKTLILANIHQTFLI